MQQGHFRSLGVWTRTPINNRNNVYYNLMDKNSVDCFGKLGI